MNIIELLKDVEILDIKNENKDLNIDMVYYNSRLVKPGGLFVAIEGLEVDGHAYIDDAIARGAVALLVTKDIDSDLPTYRTLNNRKALALISDKFYQHPSKDLKIFGLTASNGKTSTSMMLKSILEARGESPGIIGTVMYKVGDEEVASKLTTPESLELQGIFRSMVDEGIKTCIMEVSSVGQEMYRVHKTDFDIVCMNNITREHIDQHGTFEKYFEEKKKTITRAKEDAFAILNLEDPYAASLINETRARVITFSDKNQEADVYARDIDISTGFGSFTLGVGSKLLNQKEERPVKLRVAGYHSIVNALSAAAMALADGTDLETVVRGLEAYKGIERRFQQIYDDEFMVVDDHFANIGNINMTLQTLSKMAYKNAHIFYAIRGNRGVTVNGENVDTFLAWKDKLRLKTFFASKSTDTVVKHDVVSPEEEKIFRNKMEGKQAYTMFETLREGIEAIIDELGQGDVLLLAGCQGMDYGAKIFLETLIEKYPDKNKEDLFRVLEDRVAGVDDLGSSPIRDCDCGCDC